MGLRSPLINVMINAARKAARGLVRDFGEVEALQVSIKGPADFVSAADRKAEEIIREELAAARPKYGFLLEEAGAIDGEDTSNTWVVDPLDGTTNFLHGIPQFSISIALMRDSKSFAGVIYDPIADEMFWAENGDGAFMNGRRIRVGARRNLEDAVVVTGIPHRGRAGKPGYLEQLAAMMEITSGIRRFGSAALDLAWVAAGRFDGYWEGGLRPWDMAAGIIIVQEAGGIVTEVSGGTKMLESGSILAANPDMQENMGEVLRRAKAAK
ncbi:MAG: inositol monophosphatase [Alphaproteobacteria bacterium]|nr:inositol monophosphatase [Alphaproteobacteria bacterium]